MTQLPEIVKDAIDKQDVFPVATSSPEAIANVVYITYLKVVDDQTVLIADNYLHKTRDNILSTGHIAFAVLNGDKGAFQVKGRCERLTEGPLFDDVQAWVPDRLPKVAAVVMHVDEVYDGAEKIA